MDKREDEEADDDCYYFMEHSSSSIEAKLNEIQRNVNLINSELGIAERNFLVRKNNYLFTISRVEKWPDSDRKIESGLRYLARKRHLVRKNNYFIHISEIGVLYLKIKITLLFII